MELPTAPADLLRTVVETAVDGLILIDDHARILMFNPACERLFGYGAAEVLGQNVKLLMPAHYRDAHDGYMDNYQRTGEHKIIGKGREVGGRRKDGSEFPMYLSVVETLQAGRSIFVGIVHDLSDRRRLEDQLAQAQKMEAVGQLSGGVAHDFNNLLTVIAGAADELAERLTGEPELQRLANQVVVAAERGAELTRRLLDFSQRQLRRTDAVDANAIVEHLAGLIERTLGEDIRLELALAPDLPPAQANPAQLESALLNLCLNAQDAMPRGGRLIIATDQRTLDAEYRHAPPDAAPGAYVCITVSDEGHGIPPEILARVFEPFFTTKPPGKGSGLGLAMVRSFIQQMGGHLTIDSVPDLGATVRLYLPVAAGAVAMDAAPARAVDQGAGELILLVEDDPAVRQFAVAALERLNYRVRVAHDGREALAALQSGPPPDLLFTDVVMPGGLSGWDLAVAARELHPGLPVLFASGYARDALDRRGQRRPPGLMIDKPYRKADLARQIRTALGRGV